MIRSSVFRCILITLLIAPALGQDHAKDTDTDNYIQQLKDNDNSEVIISAISYLTNSNDSNATDSLIQIFADEDNNIKIEAAWALGKRGDPKAIDPLIQALGDKDSGVHAAVTEALAEIGTPAVDPLIRALHDGNSAIRGGTAEALGAIGDSKARMPLLSVLANDKDCNVRLSAAKALKKIGEESDDFVIVKNMINWGGVIQVVDNDDLKAE